MQHITEPFADDGRLKLLLFDDFAGKTIPVPMEIGRLASSHTYTPWFAITWITELGDMPGLSGVDPIERESGGYTRPYVPFDVYVLDYKLCEDGAHCRNPAHERNGMHLPAAGLAAGVMAAQNWPHHVQALIPWSAYTGEGEELLAIRATTQSYNIYIGDPDTTSKAKVNLPALLKQHAAPNFREALKDGLARGSTSIPDGEITGVRDLLARGDEWIDADRVIRFSTADGLRAFKLGSLFFDLNQRVGDRACVPAQPVRDLIMAPQRSDPIFHRARQLAAMFWNLRRTELSHQAYAAIRHNQVPPHAVTFPWIGDPRWRPGRKNKVEGARTIRLAALFLILFEYRLRLEAAELTGDLLDSTSLGMLRHLDHTYHTNGVDSFVEFCESEPWAAEAVTPIFELDEKIQARGLASAFDVLKLQLPLTDIDLIQLFDPLPSPRSGERLPENYESTLGAGQKISSAFDRLFEGAAVGAPGRDLDPAALLLQDPSAARKMLLESEWRDVNLVAAGMIKFDDFPTWLSDGGAS